jgi:hypothetical protein
MAAAIGKATAAATIGEMGGNPSLGGTGIKSGGMLALEAIISACGSGGGRSLYTITPKPSGGVGFALRAANL